VVWADLLIQISYDNPHNFSVCLVKNIFFAYITKMGGGLMQLVAYGAQDVYLTGNPQITFFKVVYRRHTNFACESIEQTLNGSVGFGHKATATISRNGDLITNCWVEANLPKLTGSLNYVPSVGHALLKEVELEIGGQRIDKHYADWLEIWSELTVPEEKRSAYKVMTGKRDVTTLSSTSFADNQQGKKLYIPLQFFFNRNPGLALPLIALQYHEVRINIHFGSFADCTVDDVETQTTTAGLMNASLYVDYVYLDTDERRRFAQVSHEMLIEQLQFTGDESVSAGSNKVRLNFNHPVKELVWVVNTTGEMFSYGEDATEELDFDPGSDDVVSGESVSSAKLLLNGHDRFNERDGSYFRMVQPYQHHTRVPNKNIYCYSFAMKPEEHQPSGTCNFSRIDNATLSLNCPYAGTAKVFATSYNVLRIMSGMGGLAYSN
jgi:hypothetical protein